MYLIVTFVSAIISGILWFIFKDRKKLHLDILTIAFSAATLMWLVDAFVAVANGEPFVSFEASDGIIAIATVVGGLFLWLLVGFILNNKEKE